MAKNELLPFADGEDANVLPTNQWEALTDILENGFQSGIARSEQVNRVLAQGAAASYVLGQLIVDQLNKNATLDKDTLYQNLVSALQENAKDACLPLSGGTMKGPIVLSIHKLLACRDVTDSDIVICGGTDADNGSYIQLYGKYAPNEAGRIWFRATDENGSAALCLKPSGEFELNGVGLNRYSMPKYDSAISFSSTEYVAPKDGWIFLAGTTVDVENWTGIFVDGVRISSVTSWAGSWAGTTFQIAFPVTKGAKVTGLGGNGMSVGERLFVPMYGV